MSDAPQPSPGGLGSIFRAEALPRWRAGLAVLGFGSALLSAGGMLEYGSGSPATQGTPAATYWALFFALNTIAFGGAALLAGFPRLTQLRIKLAWVALLAVLYALAFAVWYRQQPAAALPDWLARSTAYIPAALAVMIGLLLRPAEMEPPVDERPCLE